MKTFVTMHGEKILAAAIVIPCLWWMVLSGRELLFKSPASEMIENLDKVRKALKDPDPELSEYDYAKDVPRYELLADLHLKAAVGSGDPFSYGDDVDSVQWIEPPADFQPAEHMFYGRPPEGVRKGPSLAGGTEPQYKEVFASILPPTDVSAQPRLGQVVITWQEGATNLWGGVQEFIVFKKAADEKDWPAEPTGTVAVRPPGPGVFNKVNFEKLKLARYSYSDNDVEPQKKYTYRVRTRGVQAPDKQVGKIRYLVRVGKNLEQNPQTDDAGKVVRIELMTTFSKPIEVSTQSDIAIVFKGDLSVGGRRAATFLVMRWNVEKSDWNTAMARNVPMGQLIVGKHRYWDPTEGQSVRIIKSGYKLVDLKDETRRIERERRRLVRDPKTGKTEYKMVKYIANQRVKMAIVEEVFNGKKHSLDQGKTLGATTEDIPAEKATTPNSTVPRHLRRRAP